MGWGRALLSRGPDVTNAGGAGGSSGLVGLLGVLADDVHSALAAWVDADRL